MQINVVRSGLTRPDFTGKALEGQGYRAAEHPTQHNAAAETVGEISGFRKIRPWSKVEHLDVRKTR